MVRVSDVWGGLWLSELCINQLNNNGTKPWTLTLDATEAFGYVATLGYLVADVQAEVSLLVRLDATFEHGGRHGRLSAVLVQWG